MSFLELRTPRDILEKAKREYGRLDQKFDIDNVFNFFVTANHIRDYVEKSGAVKKLEIEKLFTDVDMKDCRDLCDKAKHLKLTKRPDPRTDRLSGCIGGAPIGALPINGSGEWELVSNGRRVGIRRLADRVIQKWEAFFEEHGI